MAFLGLERLRIPFNSREVSAVEKTFSWEIPLATLWQYIEEKNAYLRIKRSPYKVMLIEGVNFHRQKITLNYLLQGLMGIFTQQNVEQVQPTGQKVVFKLLVVSLLEEISRDEIPPLLVDINGEQAVISSNSASALQMWQQILLPKPPVGSQYARIDA